MVNVLTPSRNGEEFMRGPVLVVEDDDILRWLMTEAVTHLGHDVVECASADDAMQNCKRVNRWRC